MKYLMFFNLMHIKPIICILIFLKKVIFLKGLKQFQVFNLPEPQRLGGYKDFKWIQTVDLLNDDELYKAKIINEMNCSENNIDKILKAISDNPSNYYVYTLNRSY